jgi:hypothetical protein
MHFWFWSYGIILNCNFVKFLLIPSVNLLGVILIS